MRKLLNIKRLLNIIGGLLIIESTFMLIPMLTGVLYGESDWEIFLLTALITGSCGLLMRHIRPTYSHMGKREGFLLTASVWVVFSLFGMLPFIFGQVSTGISSGFFEAMSAFTTTGASTMTPTSPGVTHALLMWQAIMQWLGGMGIILFTLAIIPALNSAGGMQMFNAEVTGVTHEKLWPRINQTAMVLWGLYFLLTVILIFLLWLGPMDLFDSICHAFGTMSTGGFSTRDEAIAEFNSDYVVAVITLFMFLGGVNFGVIVRAVRSPRNSVQLDEVLKFFLLSIIVFTLAFILTIAINGIGSDWRDYSIYPLFQVVSTITSTGYMAPGFSLNVPFLLAMTFVLMFSGGCAGSTSGGAKIDRLIYIRKYISNEVRRRIHPSAIYSVRMNGVIVDSDIVSKVIAFLCLYMVLIVAGGMVLSMMGLPTVDSFFSAFSAMSNTGFGASVTGYGDDYMTIPNGAKWVLAFLMLAGRLEIYTVLVLFTRSFWRR